MKQKRIIILLLAVLLLGCSMGGTEKQSEATEQPAEQQPPESEPEAGGSFWGPKLYLNGKELNVYTSHYFIKDTYASIPLNAFLKSVGAVYADSSYNRYQVQSYKLC